ncbi:hypothetical protein JJB07_06735 [Tumebacillus sp. ITR2]|uniref:Uncharacterized protein n=1 Tax=Tumebacillus amylolyticus TaxID=2801339 RepID=A0ABS1J7W5_9BACL|nr:hypothetical protein [Tumebacillus amylolyticus]MBL0386339.1 hypothetical protein [Tumebacillus amylolyticus]
MRTFLSDYFDLQELDAGIFAAISKGEAVVSNTGIVDLGDWTLVLILS